MTSAILSLDDLPPGHVSENFTIQEFTCRCGCGRWCVNHLLILTFEETRREFGNLPVNLTEMGGFRCNGNWKRADWNHARGGADFSWHSVGGAGDHYIKDVPPHELFKYYLKRYPSTHGLMLYGANGFVHTDIRQKPYRKIVSHKR